jgi:hypothetical protein
MHFFGQKIDVPTNRKNRVRISKKNVPRRSQFLIEFRCLRNIQGWPDLLSENSPMGVFFGQFFLNSTEVAHIFGLLFSTVKAMHSF